MVASPFEYWCPCERRCAVKNPGDEAVISGRRLGGKELARYYGCVTGRPKEEPNRRKSDTKTFEAPNGYSADTLFRTL